MAKSNKPVVWGLFAAGGTLAAFVLPALIALTLLAAIGHAPAGMSYDRLHALAAHWAGKAILFGVLFLALWHAAHRLRITLHDFGIRSDTLVAVILYALAAAGTLLGLVALLRI